MQSLIKNQGLLSNINTNNTNNTNNSNRVSCVKSCINTCSNNTNKPKGLDCNVYCETECDKVFPDKNNNIVPSENDFNSCNEKCLKDCAAGSAHHPAGFDCNEYCSKVCNKKFPNSSNNLGNDVDEYGCKPSAGERWCKTSRKCVQNWDEDCSDNEDDKQKRRREKKAETSERCPGFGCQQV